MAAGRPSDFTPQLGLEICAQIMEGKSLNTICASKNMPNVRTIYRWLASNEAFCQQYTRAREDQADTLADQLLNIADDSSRDTIPIYNDKGEQIGEKADQEWINRSRLRVDTRKWIASKLKPKKYGEKIDANFNGGLSFTIRLLASDEVS